MLPSFLPALLALADGTVFRGYAIGAPGHTVGEVVFNTAITGYQEILTDPSYARQIVTLTYPHIGNVGVNAEDIEAARVHAAGLIVRDLPVLASNFRMERPLGEYLRAEGVVAIAGIDTRKLTRILREKGAQNGALLAGFDRTPQAFEQAAAQALELARSFAGLAGMDLAKVVSTRAPYEWTGGAWRLGEGYRTAGAFAAPSVSGASGTPSAPGAASGNAASSASGAASSDAVSSASSARQYRVAAFDFGVKRNILRMLVERGCHVTVLPAQTDAASLLALAPDGVFFSNGPGDPEPCDYAIAVAREVIARGIPAFGICLGHQIMGLAVGAQTMKMKTGHHGANHPVKDLRDGRVVITSQNHGFAVDAATLPANARVTHVSLFDGTLQGFELTDRPALCFQGHPEASPGPHDIGYLFDRFITLMDGAQRASAQGAR